MVWPSSHTTQTISHRPARSGPDAAPDYHLFHKYFNHIQSRKGFHLAYFLFLHPTREQGNKEKIVKKYCQSIADFVCRNNAANFNTSDEISDVFLAFPTLSPKECTEEIETVRTQEGGHSKYFDRGLLLGKKWCSRSQDRCYIQSTQVKSGATPTTHHPPPILYFLPTMGPIVGKKFNFLPSLLKLSQSGPCLPRVCGSMCLYSIVSIL